MPTGVRVAGGLGLVGALILGPMSVGYAAGLGGLNSVDLLTRSGEPSVGATMSDDFNTKSNADLSGRTLDGGQTWAATTGDFRLDKRRNWLTAQNANSPLSLATLPWPSLPSTRVESNIAGLGAGQFGLLLHADRQALTGVALRFLSSGQVEIARLHNGNWATLASTTSSSTGAWSLTYDRGTYTADLRGTPMLSYTATPAQASAGPACSDVGVFVEGPNATDAAWKSISVDAP